MRPPPGDETAAGRSRTTSFNDNQPTPLARPNNLPQMTCFFANEDSFRNASPPATSPAIHPKQRESPKDHNYGVESLETTISSLSHDSDDGDDSVRRARKNWKRKLAISAGEISDDGPDSPSLSSKDMSRNVSPSHQRRSSQVTLSRPFTPLSCTSPGPLSALSGPDSRGNSDAGSETDENTSQAIISSGEDEREINVNLMDSGSAPQLVMPSIRMPSRRPFTEKGKYMGRLKVLIAGDTGELLNSEIRGITLTTIGTGKTSLIKAIVQTCEDIVHVDPLITNPSSTSVPQSRKSSRSKSRSGSTDLQATTDITEIYASTRAYPAWWSDLEESRVLRRRKSMGDSVLERNLCFVDTPGYGDKTSVGILHLHLTFANESSVWSL